MKVCGFISEYNPYHNGHAYQFKESMKRSSCTHSIVVMSGDFVQRGEPAIINKFTRAEVAIKCGADLVIELPSILATASAEHFAFGAVNILNRTGVVDYLSFGSESGNISDLEKIAEHIYIESDEYKDTLKSFLKDGFGYPSARSKTIELLYGIDFEILSKSNNILAIEYIKALKQLGSKIKPITIKRIGDAYNDKYISSVASATAIRELIKKGDFKSIKNHLPTPSYEAIIKQREDIVYVDDIYKFLRYKILNSSPDELMQYQDVTEGIENTLKSNIHFTNSFEDLFSHISTKRFTKSKIRRAMLNIYLGHSKHLLRLAKNNNPYIKVLAFNKKGTDILRTMKRKDEDIKIIVNNKKGFHKLDSVDQKLFLSDTNTSLLYNHLICIKNGKVKKNDFQKILRPL